MPGTGAVYAPCWILTRGSADPKLLAWFARSQWEIGSQATAEPYSSVKTSGNMWRLLPATSLRLPSRSLT